MPCLITKAGYLRIRPTIWLAADIYGHVLPTKVKSSDLMDGLLGEAQ